MRVLLTALLTGVAAQALGQSSREPGTTYRDCPDCPSMVVIPAGQFSMGSADAEEGRENDEGPVHRVSISRGFALGKTEVTVGEYRRFVAQTGYKTDAEKNVGAKGCYAWDLAKWDWREDRYWDSPGFAQSESHPVTCVSWGDAKAYLEWLSKRAGRRYHLPSEAQWEYAARSGAASARYWGNNANEACRYANVADKTAGPGGVRWVTAHHDCLDGSFFTTAVGSLSPNGFGLHDMLGNVWEWAEDCYNESYAGAPADGSAWRSAECGRGVVRGGSWNTSPRYARSARRNWSDFASRVSNRGFRAASALE